MSETINKPMNDSMLTVTRLILYFLFGILLFAAGVMFVATIAIGFGSEMVTSEIIQNYASPDITGLTWIVAASLALVAIVLILGALFLYKLILIVKSAGDGDPFVRANAVRLRIMAYATIAIQSLLFIISVLIEWVVHKIGDAKAGNELDLGSGLEVSLFGILLFFLLIILARIFDRGADMREELEGTV